MTEVYKLPKDRLYVSYFEGDPKNGLEPDLEAKQYWLDIGVPEDHILPGNAKDNFWGESIVLCCLVGLTHLVCNRDGSYRPLWPVQVRIYNDLSFAIRLLKDLIVKFTMTWSVDGTPLTS